MTLPRIPGARPRPALAAVAAVAVAGLLLSGCGTRASDAEVRAGVSAGPVELPQSAIDQLKAAAAGGGVPAGGESIDVPTGVVNPSAVTAVVPGAPAAAAAPGGPATGGATRPGPATAGSKPGAVAPATCTKPLDPVALGQVGTFSGLAGAVSAAARTAAAVWAQNVNAAGGLACHPVVVFSQDDGGDPAKAAALVNDLSAQKKIVALIASPVVFSIAGFRKAVEGLKLPVVGGELIAPDWNSSPYLFPEGAGIFDQIVGFLKQGVEMGHRKIAALYCVEVTACTQGIAFAKASGAKRAGGEVVYDSAISLTQTDFTAQCQNAKNSGADQLVLGMDGSAMTRVARSCAALGYRPLLSGIGGTISAAQAADPNLRSFGLAVASAVAPWTETDTPGLRDFRAALGRYAPSQPPDGASIQAWTSGKLLEAAMSGIAAKARAGAVTSALVLEGLGTVKNNDLNGLTAPLSFSPGEKAAVSSGCVYYELLTPSGWTAPRGSRKVCV